MLNHRKFHSPVERVPSVDTPTIVTKKTKEGLDVNISEFVSPTFDSNKGISFRDFNVDNLQRLGVQMSEVSPNFIKPDSEELSRAADYLNSDELISALDSSFNSNNSDNETIKFN